MSGIKLFVYGVHRTCPKRIIEDEFSRHGTVTDVFITGKGYAFVTMAEEDDADAAIKDLNGSTIDGQEVKVEKSHGRGGSSRGRRDSDRDRGGRGYDRRDRDRGRRDDRDRSRDRSRRRRDDY